MNKLRLPLTCFYMVFFTLYSLITRFTWTAAKIDGGVNAALYRSLLILGCLLALWWLFTCRHQLFSALSKPRKNMDFLFLAAFLAVLFIGALANASQLAENLYGILSFGFQLVLFYLMGRTLSESEWNRIVKYVVLFGSVIWDIACAGSLVQFFLNISYRTTYASDRGAVRQGIMDGRLFGLFSDPNFAAFTSLLLLFGLWHIIREEKKKAGTFRLPIQIFAWFSIALNVCYIIMSNSRTVYLSVVGTILFYVLLVSYKKGQEKDEPTAAVIRRLAVRAVITLAVVAVSYVILLLSLRGVAEWISPDRNTAVEMVRDDVNGENISNNRFTIWKAYLELYVEKPLFGFSTRGALPYALTKPDSYLAKTQYVTHNSYLSLLVETGAVGFCIMAAFMILVIIRSCKRIHDKKPVGGIYILFSSWLVSILIFCLCFHDIFFTMNLETMLFLSSIGFLWQKQSVD